MTSNQMVPILNLADELIYLSLDARALLDDSLAIEPKNRVTPAIPTELRAVFINRPVNQCAVLDADDIAAIGGAIAAGAMPCFFDAHAIDGLLVPKFSVIVAQALELIYHVQLVCNDVLAAIRIPVLSRLHVHLSSMKQDAAVHIVAEVDAAGP